MKGLIYLLVFSFTFSAPAMDIQLANQIKNQEKIFDMKVEADLKRFDELIEQEEVYTDEVDNSELPRYVQRWFKKVDKKVERFTKELNTTDGLEKIKDNLYQSLKNTAPEKLADLDELSEISRDEAIENMNISAENFKVHVIDLVEKNNGKRSLVIKDLKSNYKKTTSEIKQIKKDEIGWEEFEGERNEKISFFSNVSNLVWYGAALGFFGVVPQKAAIALSIGAGVVSIILIIAILIAIIWVITLITNVSVEQKKFQLHRLA